MNGAWQLYEYIGRWWRFLLLGLIVGALGGLVFFMMQNSPLSYRAVAEISVKDPGRDGFEIALPISMSSGDHPTPEMANQQLESRSAILLNATPYGFRIGNRYIQKNEPDDLWKAMVLGSLIGGLLMIGAIYAWDDVRAYRQRRESSTSSDN